MSSGFISESEIAEKRKCRQEEWEKVRKPDQPLEAPEEEYDHRSLFDRLQEQKQKRDFEYEEAHRLKNMIKGLDDDEVEFLELVDRSKLEEERKQRGEEQRELASFRSARATLSLHTPATILNIPKPPTPANNRNSSYTSQTKLLAGAVVKKRPTTADEQKSSSSSPPSTTSASCPPPTKKAKTDDTDKSADVSQNPPVDSTRADAVSQNPPLDTTRAPTATGLRCIGILPGISYSESSSDSASSDTDDEACEDSGCQSGHQHVDMIGRKLFLKQKVVSESE